MIAVRNQTKRMGHDIQEMNTENAENQIRKTRESQLRGIFTSCLILLLVSYRLGMVIIITSIDKKALYRNETGKYYRNRSANTARTRDRMQTS